MDRRKFRSEWLRLHGKYEKIGKTIFKKGIRKALFRIDYDKLETWNYEALLKFNIESETFFNTFLDFYATIGILHGKRVGNAINEEIRKDFNPETFEGNYREFIRRWLIENAGFKIVSVREELIDYVIKFIGNNISQGTDIRTISRLLQKHILSRGFYRWQIERIVRTETTAAANYGAIQAGESSGVIWEKEWISSKDRRTRRRPEDQFDHYEMDGVKVPKEGLFNVNGDLIQYPGDPEGRPGNVINCRCSVAVVAKRDANGRIIYTDRFGRV